MTLSSSLPSSRLLGLSLTPKASTDLHLAKEDHEQNVTETAEKFTALFFSQFMGEMMRGQEYAGGFGEEIFQGILAEHIGTELAKSDAGTSMVDLISQQLIQLQEKRVPTKSRVLEDSSTSSASLTPDITTVTSSTPTKIATQTSPSSSLSSGDSSHDLS